VKIIAHRGASARAPENTLAAIRLALADGAAGVEVDVRLTRDGRLAVLHDADTRRTAPGQPRLHVARCTLAKLQSLEVGSWKAPQFSGERIPSLDEVLAVLPTGREIFIELKSRAYRRQLAALDALLNPPAARGFPAPRAVIMSFHGALVRKIKNARPHWRVLLLLHRQPSARTVRRLLAEFRAKSLDGLGQNHAWSLPEKDYSAFRAAGAILSVWTVNDPAEVRSWRARGFHYLTSDTLEKSPQFIGH
jgi:glycerophosphoryl diester phosphodiesterase